jgi:hypothetical protein
MTAPEVLEALDIKAFFGILQDLAAGLGEFKYSFLHDDAFSSLTEAEDLNRVYWREMLQRAHLGAATALLRQHRWIEGAVDAACAPNLLAFAACLRGFLEASADVWDGLRGVARTFAARFRQVSAALKGELGTLHVSGELEDRLLHLQFARKIPRVESHPPVYDAKHVKDYLTGLQGEQTGSLHQCYAELCDLTHPGAASLLWFTLGAETATSTEYVLNRAPDDQAITSFCRRFRGVPPWMVRQSVNLPLVTLKTLNEFGVPELHTPMMDEVNLDDVVAWRRIKESIDRVRGNRIH